MLNHSLLINEMMTPRSEKTDPALNLCRVVFQRVLLGVGGRSFGKLTPLFDVSTDSVRGNIGNSKKKKKKNSGQTQF